MWWKQLDKTRPELVKLLNKVYTKGDAMEYNEGILGRKNAILGESGPKWKLSTKDKRRRELM